MKPGEPIIRSLETRDAPAASELLTQLGYPTRPDSIGARLAALTTRAGSEAWVAEEGGRVVGLATLHVLPLLTSDEPAGYLTSVVVAEDARGRGVGTRLIRWIAARAAARRCSRLTVTTHLRRAGAHTFYESLGFEHTGRRYVLHLEAGN